MTNWWQVLKTQRGTERLRGERNKEYDHCEQWWDSKSLHPLQELCGAALGVFRVCQSPLHQREHNGSRETKAAHKGFCCLSNDTTLFFLLFFFRKATARQPIWNYISGTTAKVTLCLLRLVVELKRSVSTQGQQRDNVSTLGHNNNKDLHMTVSWLHCKSTHTHSLYCQHIFRAPCCFMLLDTGHICERDQGVSHSQAFLITFNIFTLWPPPA